MDNLIDTLNDTWDAAYEDAGRYLILLIEALALMLGARVALGYVRSHAARLLARTQASPYAQTVVHQIITVTVYFLVLSLVLSLFGASWSTVLTFFTVTSIAIALSIQDILKSLVSGLYLLIERPFAPGETIHVKDFKGTVERVTLRTTRLRTLDGERVIIPNGVLASDVVVVPRADAAASLSLVISAMQGELATIAPEVRETLTAAPGVRPPPPAISVRKTGATGAEIAVKLWHDQDESIVPSILDRLRARFPECELVVEGV